MFWKRLVGAQESEPEAVAEVEAEVAAAASQRLGRLVNRQREEAAQEAAAPQAGGRLAEAFASNGFLTLGVPISAAAADVHRAVDDLSFAEDVDPAVLSQAQAELLSPRDRLGHELAWLPGSTSDLQQRAINAIKAGDAAAVEALRYEAAGLARLNLGLALLAPGHSDEATLRQLLADLARWEPEQTRSQIDEARFEAGLRAVDPAHFDSAVMERLDGIAMTMAEALAASRDGRQALGAAIDANSAAIRAATSISLEAVNAAYARVVDPKLQNLQAKIDEAIASLKDTPNQPAKVTSIITMLDLWSQLRLPLQRLEQARGLDDPLSGQLFSKLRDLGIRMANDHGLQSETLRLARALRHAFANVPGLQPILERDMPTLIGNVVSAQMIQLAEDAVRNLRSFCDEIRKCGFEEGAGVRTARLIDCFEQWREVDPDGDEPFEVFHQIAIVINNKATAPALSLQILDWLNKQIPPPSISPRLNQTACQLQQNINKMRG